MWDAAILGKEYFNTLDGTRTAALGVDVGPYGPDWHYHSRACADGDRPTEREPGAALAPGGGKIGTMQAAPGPPLCWPAALRAVRAWLEPWIMLWRYRPPPRPLQVLLDHLGRVRGIYLYPLP